MAEVVRLASRGPVSVGLGEAVEGFLGGRDLAASTRVVYEVTLLMLQLDLPAGVAVAEITPAMLEQHLRVRYTSSAPATYNRNLATISSLFTWCAERDLIVRSPAKGLRRRKARRTIEAERQGRAIPLTELKALWGDTRHHSLRDRTYWAMLYDTAARADELLGLDIDHINQAERSAVIIAKGGSAEAIYWSSTTIRLLNGLLKGRTQGPLFVGDRKPRSHLAPAAADLDPISGRARLSYRRAEEIWKQASGGRTLHQLRHSRLTHLAEAGEDVTMLKAKSRHRSLRSLERYVNPGPAAVRDLTNRHDPNRRDPRLPA
jgi:integrase